MEFDELYGNSVVLKFICTYTLLICRTIDVPSLKIDLC